MANFTIERKEWVPTVFKYEVTADTIEEAYANLAKWDVDGKDDVISDSRVFTGEIATDAEPSELDEPDYWEINGTMITDHSLNGDFDEVVLKR